MALVLLAKDVAMKTFANIKFVLFALGLVMLLEGCQGAPNVKPVALMDNTAFMSALDVYRHCQTGTDVDIMRAEMLQLTRAAAAQESANNPPLPLPDFVKRMMAKPASRLAADPKAMAASCALSTGQAALRAERMSLATEMFQAVLKNHSQPEYAYYADQAMIGLNQVEHAVQFAGYPDGAPAVMTISTPASRATASVFIED